MVDKCILGPRVRHLACFHVNVPYGKQHLSLLYYFIYLFIFIQINSPHLRHGSFYILLALFLWESPKPTCMLGDFTHYTYVIS